MPGVLGYFLSGMITTSTVQADDFIPIQSTVPCTIIVVDHVADPP